jgi:hypothetical protein
VGYRKPPKHARFIKGVSGNPSGRRKKAPDFESLLLRELDSKLTITENGKRKKVRKSDVIIKQYVNKALNGHTPTARFLFPYCQLALLKRAENSQWALSKANLNLNELSDEQLLFLATRGGTIGFSNLPMSPEPESPASQNDRGTDNCPAPPGES